MSEANGHNSIKIGSLLSIAEQIQAFAQSRKTGEICVTNCTPPGRINLVDGEIVDAQFGAKNGLDAAIALINLPVSSTEFVVGRETDQRSIRMPYVQILCEAARLNDENAAGMHESQAAEPAALQPGLRIMLPDNRVRNYSLKEGLVYVGRTSNNDVPIPDPTVSQHHASIEVTASGTILRDLGSRNGTYVNGNQIKECWLRDVENLQFGSIPAVFVSGRELTLV